MPYFKDQIMLFSKQRLDDLLRNNLEQMSSLLSRTKIPDNYNTQSIVDNYYNKYFGDDYITLDEDKIQSEIMEAFSDTELYIKFHIPFSGNKELFFFRPSSYSGSYPRARVFDDHIEIIIHTADKNNPDKAREEFTQKIKLILEALNYQKEQILQYNEKVEKTIKEQLEKRIQKKKSDDKFVKSLGFKLKRNEKVTTDLRAEIKRKKLVLKDYPVIKKEQEYFLEFETYSEILNICENMTKVIERSPRVFKDMDEETIRSHFLIQLNGQYEGIATAETFNFEGKTDILLRYKGKNIFIAECKFWNGQSMMMKAIDQLLGYTQWRDSKIALFIFNRNKNLSKLLREVPEIIKSHECYLSIDNSYKHESGYRFKFHHRDDREKTLVLTIMFFEIPR